MNENPCTTPQRRCFWAFATKHRCRAQTVKRIDTATTRAYYCAEHAPVVQRLLAGSGR